MGCPLRWSWEEDGRKGGPGFVILTLSLSFIHARFATCLQPGQQQCQGRALISGCCNVGTVSLCLETR